MSKTFEILSAQRKGTIAGRDIVITELPWMAARELLAKLAGQAEKFQDSEGRFSLKAEVFFSTILESTGMVEEFLAATTSLTAQDIGKMGSAEVMELLYQAVELNLEFITGTLKKFRGLLPKIGAQPPVKMTPLPPSPTTPASSPSSTS